jgi:hypothetical protein
MQPDQLKSGLVIVGIVSAVLLSIIFKHEPPPPTTWATTPQVTLSEHERVQAALAAQCTSSNIDIKYVGKDSTGTVYMAGCGRWIYSIFINPQKQIEVSRLTEWNGGN